MKELANQSRITGRFSKITEEDIENAQEEIVSEGGESFPESPPGGPEDDSPLPLPLNEKSLEELQQDLENLGSEGGAEFDALKRALEKIDVDREIINKPSAADGSVKRFFKDSVGKILKPLVGLAILYKWLKKDKKELSVEERARRLLGQSPFSPGQDSATKKLNKKEVLESIQKELKNIRSTFDEQIRAPKGGITIKGKNFAGGEFIPVEGGYATEYKKMQEKEPSTEYKKMQEKEPSKESMEETFKKKHPYVSGVEVHSDGLTWEKAVHKAEELREKGVFANIWHQEGPKSGSESKYYVTIPQGAKVEEGESKLEKSKKEKKLVYKLGTNTIARTEKEKALVELAMKAHKVTHNNLYKIADEMGDYDSVDIGIIPFNDRLDVEMKFAVGEGKARFNFNLSDKRGYVDLMSLPDSEGNKGRGHALLNSLESMLKEKGKDEIGLHADISIGGYAWAKMGFDFNDEKDLEEAKREVLRVIDAAKVMGVKVSSDDVERVKSLKSAKEVADFTIKGASFTTKEWMKADKGIKSGMSIHVPRDIKLHIGKVVLLALKNDYYAVKKV
jgi:hypothetical protein